MDVKQAVGVAKKHTMELFADEGLANLGLEEVEFKDNPRLWRVTVGFSRPWDKNNGGLGLAAAAAHMYGTGPSRSYKVVTIDDATGAVLSVRNRDLPA